MKTRTEQGPLSISMGGMATDVAAHITGTVWEIRVNVGDVVKEEQVLVVLESMKMEMPIESPQAGRVAQIQVVKGQAVEEGEVLLSLE
jgi:acetyl-CoA carboxylase biotin carboxyl carrier protein